MRRTAATAPLSLAAVKMSTSWEASVALASQATRAIHGVVANQCSAYRLFVQSIFVLARIIASGNKGWKEAFYPGFAQRSAYCSSKLTKKQCTH